MSEPRIVVYVEGRGVLEVIMLAVVGVHIGLVDIGPAVIDLVVCFMLVLGGHGEVKLAVDLGTSS